MKTKLSFIDSLILKVIEWKDMSSFGIKDKIFFLRELGYLIDGGVSILEAIHIIAQDAQSRAIKTVCEEIAANLKKGESLSRSFSRLPRFFNEADVGIVRSGENSGELVKVLQYLSKEYEFLYEIRSKYLSAMIYPALLFFLSIVAIWVIMTQVLPGIFTIIEQFDGAKLPRATVVLMSVSNFFVHSTWQLIIIIGVAVFGITTFLSTPEGKKRWDYQIFRLPVFGKIVKFYNLVRFLRFLKLLIYSGMSYNEVFDTLAKVMENQAYLDLISAISEGVKRGEPITRPMEHFKIIIPGDVTNLMKVGEETASIGKSIDNVIWLYEYEFMKIVDNLSKIIEPILIIFVGGVVGVIAMSVFGIIGTILDSIQAG